VRFDLKSGDMAKEGDKLDSLLGDARRHEKDYDWIRAAESYREAFELVPEKDYKQRGETAERQRTTDSSGIVLGLQRSSARRRRKNTRKTARLFQRRFDAVR
jgi:hypothetical protein